MPTFHYKAKNDRGDIQGGILEAATHALAVRNLSDMGLLPVELEPIQKGSDWLAQLTFSLSRKPNIESFTHQLALLIDAGVPVLEALQTLSRQNDNIPFQKTLDDIVDQLGGGGQLSEILERYPKFFSPVYTAMLRAGEATGDLAGALRHISQILGTEKKMNQKISESLRYPMMVLASLFVAGSIVIVFVIPRFGEFYSRANVPLPLPTQLMVGMGKIIVRFGWLFSIAFIGFVFSIIYFLRTARGKETLDQYILRTPGIGVFLRAIQGARFTRNLSILLSAGVHLPHALHIAGQSTSNSMLREEIGKIENQVLEGKGLSQADSLSAIVPPAVATMFSVGEKSSRLPEILVSAAVFLEEEVERKLGALLARLEPALILVVGLMVAFLAFSVFLPMWKMLSVIQS